MKNLSSAAAVPFALLLCALPASAGAEAYTSLTLGTGPDGYRSYAVYADTDLFDLPLSLNFDHFLGRSSGVEDTTQTGIGGKWKATRELSLNYRHAVTDDGILRITGNEGGISLAFGGTGQSGLRTAIDLGYGANTYEPSVHPVIVNSQSLKQDRYSFGISQDLARDFTLYASHDRYQYSRDPTAIAILLIVRSRNTSQAAYTLLGFPDKGNTLGMTWRPSENWTLDLSAGKTLTLLDQELKNTRLGMDYQLGDSLNIAAAVTRASSTALIRPSTGATVIEATQGTYTELTLGLAF